jgi:hypothetical protein
MANRIHSKGDWRHEEALAGEAGIYPGMLVSLNSAGAVIMHATEGGRGEVAIAMEDALQGKTVDDVYTNAEIVSYGIPVTGAVFNVLLQAGETAIIGSELISAGNGKFKVDTNVSSGVTIDAKGRMLIAEEALDLSASGSSDTLIAARVVA